VNTYAQNTLGTEELHKGVGLGADGVTLSIGAEVAQVTNVADLILGSTMGLAEGVEVGACRGAAVGVVTKLVDMEATLSVGVVAGDVP
jgi:tetrahydromethanopterin S-methyltransferase subunit F